MLNSSDQRIVSQLQALSRGLAAAAVGLGALVLFGWLLDIPALKTVAPGLVSMKVNAAVCFLLLGLSLWHRDRRKPATALASLALLIAASTLIEYAAGLGLGIDQLLFVDPGDVHTSYPGRMSPVAAAAFALISAAQLLPCDQERCVKISQGMLLVVLQIGFASLLGRLFSISGLDRVWGLTHMAAHAAVGFVLLAFSGLLARPSTGWMAILTSRSIAGVMARRALPLAIGLPLLGNVLRALGERAGLFDHDTGAYLLTIAGSTILMLGTIAGALAMRRLDAERRHLDLELAKQKELDSLRRNFVSAVSHELRSPLGAIAMFVQLADSQLKGEAGEEIKAREFLARINSNVERLSGFINDLLLLSQIESHKLVLALRPIRLQDMVGDLLAAYGKAGQIRGIRIDNTIASGLPPVLGDAAHLNKALSHLISNALKFTPVGGTVSLTSKLENGEVELRVNNTGAGLTEDDLRSLFQGFQQGSNVNVRHSGTQGVGIGLHLVKAIIDAHGGQVRAESKPGKGATFVITLPLASPNAAVDASARSE